jgi:hypothetical protein
MADPEVTAAVPRGHRRPSHAATAAATVVRRAGTVTGPVPRVALAAAASVGVLVGVQAALRALGA